MEKRCSFQDSSSQWKLLLRAVTKLGRPDPALPRNLSASAPLMPVLNSGFRNDNSHRAPIKPQCKEVVLCSRGILSNIK